MSGTLEHKRAATKVVKSLGLQADLRARAVVLVAADSTAGNSLRDLIQLNEDDPALKALVEEFLRGESTVTHATAGPSENMVDMRQQLARIEAATLNTFHHMFAPSISDLSQRSKLAKRICTTTYNADDRPAGQLWCMVLGRYLQDDMIKASHIYKRDWPAQTAAQLKLDVDTAANLFSAQKKIESAFDKFRLIIVPNNLSDYTLHILDPSLGSEMINNAILSASGAAVKFADIDGTALQFVTETRPAKRAFAWHAEEALHFGKAVGWPAASLLTVPPSAWSSDTCDSSIRDQYFHDLLELQAASVSDQDEGLHD